MIYAYNTFIYQPIFNFLIWLHNVIPGHDIGIAIIVLTLVTRFLLVPLTLKQIKSQKALQDLQPKMDEIKRKYKDDKEKQSKELMKFYQENKVNPLASCLPLLIQLPILFALYRAFMAGLSTSGFEVLYPFVARPETINPMFLGLVDLSQKNLTLAILAGATQFIQSKMLMPKKKTKDMAGMMSKQMTYFMPVMTVFIAMSLPAGLALYWLVTTLFAIGQQYFIMKPKKA
jgi:YidC/Oxa1 family membrane protein insertase